MANQDKDQQLDLLGGLLNPPPKRGEAPTAPAAPKPETAEMPPSETRAADTGSAASVRSDVRQASLFGETETPEPSPPGAAKIVEDDEADDDETEDDYDTDYSAEVIESSIAPPPHARRAAAPEYEAPQYDAGEYRAAASRAPAQSSASSSLADEDGAMVYDTREHGELDDDAAMGYPTRADEELGDWNTDRAEPAPRRRMQARSPRSAMNLGCVLGAAIGDALGHPTEFMSMLDIEQRYGPRGVSKFELYWERDGSRFAPYTDDTQMAEVVLRSLIEAGRIGEDLHGAMDRIAQGFVRWAEAPQGGHRAPGNACLAGARTLARGAHWSEAGDPKAGGCGSVMRAYPFGLVFANDLERAESWSVAHSRLTHRDPIALAACAAMAIGVARVIRGDTDRVVCSEMIAAACRYSPRTGAMMAEAWDEAQRGIGPETTLERNRGWAAHEAIAAAVYIFARHSGDFRLAVLEGANTPGDSDSIATLAGALVGARMGVHNIPADWISDLERTLELQTMAEALSRDPTSAAR